MVCLVWEFLRFGLIEIRYAAQPRQLPLALDKLLQVSGTGANQQLLIIELLQKNLNSK
jgi:hypothetical protein